MESVFFLQILVLVKAEVLVNYLPETTMEVLSLVLLVLETA